MLAKNSYKNRGHDKCVNVNDLTLNAGEVTGNPRLAIWDLQVLLDGTCGERPPPKSMPVARMISQVLPARCVNRTDL